jgi:hypothetical protein
MHQGQTVWDGEVQVFEVTHPKASRVYCWSHESGANGKRRFHAVLGAPPPSLDRSRRSGSRSWGNFGARRTRRRGSYALRLRAAIPGPVSRIWSGESQSGREIASALESARIMSRRASKATTTWSLRWHPVQAIAGGNSLVKERRAIRSCSWVDISMRGPIRPDTSPNVQYRQNPSWVVWGRTLYEPLPRGCR